MTKRKSIYQLNMFGDEEKLRKPRKKMSDQEKQERKEKRELEKKIKQQEEFEKRMAELGHPQLQFDFNESINNNIKHVVKEQIDKFIEESTMEIKPENKGKFTKTKKETGKTTSQLLHSKNKLTKARANFVRMAKRGWKPLKK